MKKMAWVFFVLISIALFAVTTFVSIGPTYIGGSYYESGNFQESFDYKIQEIGPVLLSRLDVDEEIENLQVEPYEVEQYRDYYGSQIDQIISVQEQYQELINEADSNGDERSKDELEKVRDTKIDDIRKNFEDDDTVSEKILSAKKEVLRKYDAQISNVVSQAKVTQKSLAYNLTNVETGESFVFGDIQGRSSIYESFQPERRILDRLFNRSKFK